MFKHFSYKSLFSGLKLYKDIFKSLIIIPTYFPHTLTSFFKLFIAHRRELKKLRSLNCPLKYMTAHYFYIDNNHLEFYPLHGLLIKKSKHITKNVAKITALDEDLKSLEHLKLTLQNQIFYVKTMEFDINKLNFPIKEKFNSISLNFALNKIDNSKQSIDSFFTNLKKVMSDGSVLFGLAYSSMKKNDIVYINDEYSVTDLKKSLNKHFDKNTIDIINSCIVFKGFIKKKPKNFDKRRPTVESTKGKHLKIHHDSLRVWLKNIDKFK